MSRFREVIHVPKTDVTKRDPRFSEDAGHLNLDLFKKTYSFVDEIKKNEKKILLKEVRKTRNQERKTQLQRLLQSMVSIKKYNPLKLGHQNVSCTLYSI